MSIPGCYCVRCREGRVHEGAIIPPPVAPPILSESDPRIVIDPKPAPAPQRYARFDALLTEIKALHDSKGADYEGGGGEYANLKAAEQWGIPAWTYAMLRVDEKLNRLKTAARGGTLNHEGVRDSQIDIAVLSLIAVILKEERERGK